MISGVSGWFVRENDKFDRPSNQHLEKPSIERVLFRGGAGHKPHGPGARAMNDARSAHAKKSQSSSQQVKSGVADEFSSPLPTRRRGSNPISNFFNGIKPEPPLDLNNIHGGPSSITVNSVARSDEEENSVQ